MKRRRIRRSILGYFIQLMEENNVRYEVDEVEGELFCYVTSDMTSKQYHRFVERAMCMAQSKKSGRNVISYNEWRNNEFPKDRPYHILRKDLMRYLKEVC